MDCRIFVVLAVCATTLTLGCVENVCPQNKNSCTDLTVLKTADVSEYAPYFNQSSILCDQSVWLKVDPCCPRSRYYDCGQARLSCLPLFWYRNYVCQAVKPTKLTYVKCTCDSCIPNCTNNGWCYHSAGKCTQACGVSTTVYFNCLVFGNGRPYFISISERFCLPTRCFCKV
ncbi:uncharacterized protein LOC131929643 [Physella acuta]|uniref:uncharacterized protein LOC131929643 n=1 Tax=Physella acuta TaxID=109671 RepID=UPI0027DABC6F|nr:uncharacterized protein LOC131929643 [Physella acuta]